MVIAVKNLGPPQPEGYEYILVGDNTGAVSSLSTGKTDELILASCAREIWLHAVTHDIRITVIHAPGKTMTLADALSRMGLGVGHRVVAERMTKEKGLEEVHPNLKVPLFTDGL